MSDPIPDIVAHHHECPDCGKEYECTDDVCEDLLYILCDECDDDYFDSDDDLSDDEEL